MNLLEVKGLTKRYPAFTLQEVSFSVEQGSIMGLIGRNGAGKSTTLKAMLNIVRPDGGTICMLGRDFQQEEEACKQELGVVLSGSSFYPAKTLKTITDVTKRFYPNWDDAAYRGYLSRFELDPHKRFQELSEGMKVKYRIALALSHGAKLLLFDEPTSGLDPVARDDLLELFRELVQGGERSILFSTHITSDLEKCADGITYIQKGRVVASMGREAFVRSFQSLKEPGEQRPLTLEEIMIRSERSARHG